MLRHILILLIISLCLQATAIKIEGTEPAYAAKRLSFMTISDPVSRTEKQLFSVIVDASGKFSADIEVNRMIYCYVDFGIYRGKLLLMPEKDMRVQLPPLREKSFEESKNPYFEPVELWLKVEDDNALVNQVSRFENRFYGMTENYFVQLYQRRQKNYLDTISRITDKEFARFQSPEFQQHKRLTFKTLEADLMRAGREKLIATSDAENPEIWKQPAFTEFFNRLFMNTLSMESKVAAGSKLRMWVAQKNLNALKTWTESFSATTSPLSDLILLKLLHDAWYSGEFSKPAIQQMVQSPFFTGNSVAEIRDAAGETAAKLSYLVKGSKAPEICLPLLTQSTYCTASSALPYQYLLFVDLEIPVCQEHVKYLKTMAEKTGNTLRILIVALPSKKINITEFLSSNQVPGITILDTDDKSTGKKYKIRSYPAAFLLDKDHQVVLAPAKTPLDGFEHQFAALKK